MKGKFFVSPEKDQAGYIQEKVGKGFYLVTPMDMDTGELYVHRQHIVSAQDMKGWMFSGTLNGLANFPFLDGIAETGDFLYRVRVKEDGKEFIFPGSKLIAKA